MIINGHTARVLQHLLEPRLVHQPFPGHAPAVSGHAPRIVQETAGLAGALNKGLTSALVDARKSLRT